MTGLLRWTLALSLVLGGSFPGPVRAADEGAPLAALSIGRAQQILQDKGYRAEIITGSGTPYLKSQSGGTYFFVSFYECAEPAAAEACTAIELTTAPFTLRPAPTAMEMARWNADNWWGFGVFDSTGSPYLRHYFSTTGGVTEAHIRNLVERWDWRMNEFTDFLRETAAPEPYTPPAAAPFGGP